MLNEKIIMMVRNGFWLGTYRLAGLHAANHPGSWQNRRQKNNKKTDFSVIWTLSPIIICANN